MEDNAVKCEYMRFYNKVFCAKKENCKYKGVMDKIETPYPPLVPAMPLCTYYIKNAQKQESSEK